MHGIVWLLLFPPQPLCHDATPLVTQLGSSHWQIREEATKRLSTHGWEVSGNLRLGMNSPDPEVRWRSRKVFGKLCQHRAKRFEPWPYIDMLWLVDKEGWNVHSANMDRYDRYLLMAGEDEKKSRKYRRFEVAYGLLIQDWLVEGVPEWMIWASVHWAREKSKEHGWRK